MSWSMTEPVDDFEYGEHDAELMTCGECGQFWASPDINAYGKCVECAPVVCQDCEHEFPRHATYFYGQADHREMLKLCARCWIMRHDAEMFAR